MNWRLRFYFLLGLLLQVDYALAGSKESETVPPHLDRADTYYLDKIEGGVLYARLLVFQEGMEHVISKVQLDVLRKWSSGRDIVSSRVITELWPDAVLEFERVENGHDLVVRLLSLDTHSYCSREHFLIVNPDGSYEIRSGSYMHWEKMPGKCSLVEESNEPAQSQRNQ